MPGFDDSYQLTVRSARLLSRDEYGIALALASGATSASASENVPSGNIGGNYGTSTYQNGHAPGESVIVTAPPRTGGADAGIERNQSSILIGRASQLQARGESVIMTGTNGSARGTQNNGSASVTGASIKTGLFTGNTSVFGDATCTRPQAAPGESLLKKDA